MSNGIKSANTIPAWIGEIDGIISHVSVAVPVRWGAGVWYNRVGLNELVKIRVIPASSQINQLCGIPRGGFLHPNACR